MSTIVKLSEESKRRLNEALTQLNQLHQEADKIEECGIDCQRHREEIAKLIRRGEAIRKHYDSQP